MRMHTTQHMPHAANTPPHLHHHLYAFTDLEHVFGQLLLRGSEAVVVALRHLWERCRAGMRR